MNQQPEMDLNYVTVCNLKTGTTALFCSKRAISQPCEQ